ncbi:MAG: hypothetical protein V4539_24710 [Bacteroidota bacterium]
MCKQKILFLLFGILFISAATAQKIDSVLSLYHDNYQPEKIHIHFDKSTYTKGETIWFKAYILAGESISDYSRNFFVDWYDDGGQLIKHTVNPVFESSSRAQFMIPANYTGEMLHLKAYTRWMLNFDTAFLYIKDIRIINSDAPAKSDRKPSIATSIRFFPEGGDLVNGVGSTVAFIANNQSGNPVAVRGAILNSKNELIDSFASVHDGMGSFSFEPSSKETYTCNWIDEYGTNHTSPLPAAKSTGIAMESQLVNHKVVFAVKRSAEISDNLRSLHIVASMNQLMVYSAAINLGAKKISAGEIPTETFPTGVLQVTVFDANWLPVAERVLFVKNKQHQFFPDVKLVTQRFGKRMRNEIEIYVPDTLSSNLSISVTDAGLVYDSSTNIFSQLLLQGDIKGYIPNAADYFSKDDEDTRKNLDLVMLTHGWRRYKWDDIVKAKLPMLPYPMDSDYVQIKGRVYTNGQGTIRSGQNIALIMQGKDSSKQYFMLPLKQDGSFNQRGIILFDTARLFYQLTGDRRIADASTVKFQYGLPLVPYAQATRIPRFADPDSTQLLNNYLFYSGIARNKKSLDSGFTLQEVIVQSKLKSAIDVLDEKYTTGLFSSRNSYSFDVLHDERTRGQIDVFHYLQNMIPGLSMSLPILGQNGVNDANPNNVPGLNWRDGTPEIFLNEMPSDAERTMGISMSEIAYIKVFRPPFMSATGSGASGAIAIYTKKPSDVNTSLIRGLNNALITGYTPYKEFFSPDYATPQSKLPDTRATLYWNPYVMTDKKMRTIKLEFFNNDITKKFRIVLEGVNAAGKLARVEKVVE